MSDTQSTDQGKLAGLPPGSPCTNCGKCCTHPDFMGSLMAMGADVQRWRRERRADILRFAQVLGPRDDPWADLWSTKRAGSAGAARLCARSGARPATYARFTKPGRRSAVTISRGRPVRFARSYDRPATTRDQDGLMEAVGEAVRWAF